MYTFNKSVHTLFCKKLRSSLITGSFLASCDFEYSKFLNSFLTFYLQIEQALRKHKIMTISNLVFT